MQAPSSSFIYLASQSPRRRQLLEQAGVAYELLLPDASEDTESLEAPFPNEAPLRYVKRVTHLKLQAALQRLKARHLPPAPVLCSDTTVALGPHILGKPHDAQDAQRMLNQLSGVTHRVLTAVCLGQPAVSGVSDSLQISFDVKQCVSISKVRFAKLTGAQIEHYVASGEPMGKAGAYAIQGRAAGFVEHMSGSYSGIMGLPLFETLQLLKSWGIEHA
jgi:septum formation protein